MRAAAGGANRQRANKRSFGPAGSNPSIGLKSGAVHWSREGMPQAAIVESANDKNYTPRNAAIALSKTGAIACSKAHATDKNMGGLPIIQSAMDASRKANGPQRKTSRPCVHHRFMALPTSSRIGSNRD
jgi:hypothetical protein